MRMVTVAVIAACGGGGGGGPDARPSDARTIDASTIDAAPRGPVMWLKMDDDPADGAADSAGAHNATCTACPTVTDGHASTGVQFAGGGLLSVPTAPDLMPPQLLTVAFWARFRSPSAGTNMAPICKLVASGSPSLCFVITGISTGPKLGFYASPVAGVLAAGDVPTDRWVHIAVTRSPLAVKGYIDGAVVAQDTPGPGAIVYDGSPITLGGDGRTLTYTGDLDDVRIYDYDLSDAQIQQLAAP